MFPLTPEPPAHLFGASGSESSLKLSMHRFSQCWTTGVRACSWHLHQRFTTHSHQQLAVDFSTATLSSRLWKPSQQNGVLARPIIQSLAADLQCYILSPGCCGTQTIHEFPSWCTSKMSCPLRSPKEPPCKPKRGHTKDAKSNFKTKA